jgi:Protein of unknown function (DUF2752)
VTPMTNPPPAQWADYPPYAEQDRLTRFVQRTISRSPIWVAPVAMLACMGAAAGYTVITHPTHAGAGAAPTCLLKYTTGFDCPGCGGTRAAWYLLHGDLPAAGRAMFGWKLPQLNLSPRVIGVFLAAWGVWSVLRNLPWAPFTYFYV